MSLTLIQYVYVCGLHKQAPFCFIQFRFCWQFGVISECRNNEELYVNHKTCRAMSTTKEMALLRNTWIGSRAETTSGDDPNKRNIRWTSNIARKLQIKHYRLVQTQKFQVSFHNCFTLLRKVILIFLAPLRIFHLNEINWHVLSWTFITNNLVCWIWCWFRIVLIKFSVIYARFLPIWIVHGDKENTISLLLFIFLLSSIRGRHVNSSMTINFFL